MPLQHVHHIAVQVNDITQATNWYKTSFDCEVALQTDTKAIIKFENIDIVLVLPSQEQPHLAFIKADAHTYGELRAKTEGIQSCYVADPAGNIIELGLIES